MIANAFFVALVAVLTSIDEARRVPDEACNRPVPFRLTGRFLSSSAHSWIFHDGTNGIEIHSRTGERTDVPRGSDVCVTGEMALGENGIRVFRADPPRVLHAGPPPEPVAATAADIRSGIMDYHFVSVTGVISSATRDEIDEKYCWATLRTDRGQIFLTFGDKWNDLALLRDLIDATVVVTGLATPITGFRRNLGHCLSVGRDDAIVRLKQPIPTPFGAPDLADTTAPHRQKVRGTVLAAEIGRFYVRTSAGRLIAVHPAADADFPPPAAGASVTVSGFASENAYRLQLDEALVAVTGRTADAETTCLPRTIADLYSNSRGSARIDSHADGTFICVRGTVSKISTSELLVREGDHSVSLSIATLSVLGVGIPENASLLSVCGLCIAEFENPTSPTMFPVFKRFVLIPRTAADVRVLSTPSWWTPFRLVVAIALLATALIGSGLWNFLLKRKSERRGQALYEEKIGHALAEQKVEERTRLSVELHDSVSQTLTGIALQLDGGEVETAKAMLASCRAELRRCLWDLRIRTFEEKDMTEAITRTIAPHLNGCSASVRFNVPRERLSESLTHAILRIVRELVVNAVRHGRAQHVKIAGETHDDTVSFSVRDDGVGFDPSRRSGPEQGHFGLLGVRERIDRLDGELTIASSPGQGAKFTITLPALEETDER